MSQPTVTVIVRTAEEARARRIRFWLLWIAVTALFVVALVDEPLDFLWH